MSASRKNFFYSAGKLAGKKLSKASWIWHAVTGDKARCRKAEYRVGKEVYLTITQNSVCNRQSKAGSLVKQIGEKLVERLKKQDFPFTFEVLEGGQVNAFAVPGGFIFVNSSLVEFCGCDEDKIAFVLAHETGHIVKGHAMERVLTDIAASSAVKAGTISGSVGAWIRRTGFRFLQTGYSRYQETEADLFAVKLMQAAGFRADKAVEFLQDMGDSNRRKGEWEISKHFSTHPEFEERIQTIRKCLEKNTR